MDVRSRIIQVIETTYTKGDGTKENPVRRVKAYFDFKGNLICERDEFFESIEIKKRGKGEGISITQTFDYNF